MSMILNNSIEFLEFDNKRVTPLNNSVGILDGFSKYLKKVKKDEYINKIKDILKEKENVRNEINVILKENSLNPLEIWKNRNDNSISIYFEMMKVYKKYSNKGIYEYEYSKKLERKDIKELLLELEEED